MKRFLVVLVLLMAVSFAAEDAFRIQNQKTFPTSVQAGDKEVIMQLDLYHAGRITYENITVELDFSQQFEAVKSTYSLERLLPGQTATVSFRFNVKPGVDPGTYTIPLTIKYTETSGPYVTMTNKEIYISISSTPSLKLQDILFSPSPHIGQDFNIIFVINNTGALPASNVVANISVASTAHITWIPDYQTIDYIAPNSISNISFKGVVSSESGPGAYQGAVSLAYSNKTLSNSFILEIHGKPDVKLAGSQTDKTPYVGEKITLSVQLEDIGKEKARSVQAKLKDSTLMGTLTSYVGTIEPDDTGSAIFDITLAKAGSYTIPLEFTYTDDEGNTYVQSEDIMLFVYTRPFDFSGVVLLAIVAAVLWYWMKRRKKKRTIDKMVE